MRIKPSATPAQSNKIGGKYSKTARAAGVLGGHHLAFDYQTVSK